MPPPSGRSLAAPAEAAPSAASILLSLQFLRWARLDMYLERIRRGSVSTKTLAEVVSDRSAAVTLDAAHALGQLTGEQAIELAIERARQFGAGIVAVRHAFHFGTARRYAQLAAAAG